MKIDLSNSEWKLMNRLWQNAPMTITELTAALPEVVEKVAVVQTVSDELWEQAKKLLREHHL